MAAWSAHTLETELRGDDGSHLRIDWTPTPGIQARAYLTEPNAAERPYATVYAAQSHCPHDYPADLPFLADRTVVLAHSTGPHHTAAGYWPAHGQAAAVMEQIAVLSCDAGWTRGATSARPSIGATVIHVTELHRGAKRRLVMAMTGTDDEMVSVIDNSTLTSHSAAT